MVTEKHKQIQISFVFSLVAKVFLMNIRWLGNFGLDKQAVIHRRTQVIGQSGNSWVLKQAAERNIDMEYFTQPRDDSRRQQ